MKLINFRIEDSLRGKLEELKTLFALKRDKSLSLSDTVRTVLTQATDEQYLRLLKMPDEIVIDDLVIIKKVENGQSLTKWEFSRFLQMGCSAYRHISCYVDTLNKEYFIDILHALKSVLMSEKYLDERTLRYILEKMPSAILRIDQAYLRKEFCSPIKPTTYDDLYGRIDNLIQQTKEAQSVGSGQFEAVLSSLEYLTTQYLEYDKRIMHYLSPWIKTFIHIAKFYYRKENEKPLFTYLDRTSFVRKIFNCGEHVASFSDPIYDEHCSLHASLDVNISIIIGFKNKNIDNTDQTFCDMGIDYPIMNDLYQCSKLLHDITDQKTIRGKEISIDFCQGSDSDKDKINSFYILSRGFMKFYLSIDQLTSLNKVVQIFYNRYPDAMLSLKDQWGDV